MFSDLLFYKKKKILKHIFIIVIYKEAKFKLFTWILFCLNNLLIFRILGLNTFLTEFGGFSGYNGYKEIVSSAEEKSSGQNSHYAVQYSWATTD